MMRLYRFIPISLSIHKFPCRCCIQAAKHRCPKPRAFPPRHARIFVRLAFVEERPPWQGCGKAARDIAPVNKMAHPPRAAGVSTLAVPGPSDQAAGAQVQHRAGPARALQRVKTSGAALAWVLSVHTRSRRQAARRIIARLPGVRTKPACFGESFSGKELRGKGIVFEGSGFIPHSHPRFRRLALSRPPLSCPTSPPRGERSVVSAALPFLQRRGPEVLQR